MTVDELIEKLKEFDGSLQVESIEYADVHGCSCCGGIDYEYGWVSDPYLDSTTDYDKIPDKRARTGYRLEAKQVDVVRIDAR